MTPSNVCVVMSYGWLVAHRHVRPIDWEFTHHVIGRMGKIRLRGIAYWVRTENIFKGRPINDSGM